MKSLLPVFKAAVVVGLFEGIHIARWDVLMGDWTSVSVLEALGAVGWIAALHIGVWMFLGAIFVRVFREPFPLFRAVFSVWAVVALLARWMLLGETGPYELLLATLLAMWLVPRSVWARLSGSLRMILVGLALFIASTFSLWGRVPDFAYPLGEQAWLYGTSAALALLVSLAFFHWPRAMAATIVGCVVSIALWGAFAGTGSSDKPNVLWILIDTTRRDHVRPFGSLAQTPAIEKLAAEGILFEDAVTVIPKTPQSVASFFTGRYPIHHGLRTLHDELKENQPSVVRLFNEAGYRTAAFVNNPWLSKDRGFGQGFERYYSIYELGEKYGGGLRYVSWFVLADRLTVKRIETPSAKAPKVYQAQARTVTDSVSRYLRSVKQQPFFLYVHYFEPHWPYLPPPELEKRYDAPPGATSKVNFPESAGITHGELIFANPLSDEENEGARRLYRGEIDDTMSEVGRLLEELERAGFRDNTMVVFTADHGHSLGDHDYYFHHGAFLYESSVRIPLILSWPKKLPEGLTVSQQVRSIDVAPTLLGLARIRNPGEMDGRTLAGFWEGREDRSRPAFLESDVKMLEANRRRPHHGVVGKLRAVRDGRFKLILTPEEDGPRFELYDVIADPEEAHDLVLEESQKEVLAALQKQLAALIPKEERRALAEIRGKQGGGLNEPVDERDRELLQSLGYINQ